MSGNYILSAMPVNEVGPNHYSVKLLADLVPSALVQASSLGELANSMDAFERSVKELGKPYCVTVMKHPRCKARKISGFDKARDNGGLLAKRFGNCETVTVGA